MVSNNFLDDLILANAVASPNKTAIRFNQNTLSYNELAAQVNGLTAALVDKSIAQSRFVAVLLEPSEYITVSMLAIFRCGGVYAPMDPEHPDVQILEKFDEIQPLVLITHRHLADRVAGWGVDTIFVDDIVPADGNPITDDQRSPNDPACIFFTSGTTGKAKGVLGNYEALTASIVEPSQHLKFTPDDVLNSIARYAWSISMLELMCPLVAGGTSLILDKAKALDLDWLKQQAESCTAFHCPPALLKTLAEHIEHHFPENQSLNKVRLVWYGGDTFPIDTIVTLHNVFPRAQVGTAYGATEIFGLSHCYLYKREALSQKVLIGKPVGHMTQLLLDQGGQPVGIGEVGELFLGGERIATSYWQRSELTAEKFPLIEGKRYFATGDYAKLDESHDLEYLQRLDTQVKIRGIRIELGEVEFHLSSIPEIKSAVVIAKDDGNASKLLYGFVVLHSAGVLSVAAIRDFLNQVLPDYMVPHSIIIVDALPYTENFKVDRKALAEYQLEETAFKNDEADKQSGGETANKIADLWLEAAKVSPQNESDNFFEIGGNSISAILLASLLSRELGSPVEVADIYRNPVFSQQVDQFSQLVNEEAVELLASDTVHGALAQLGLFFRELFERRDASITCTRYITCDKGFDDALLAEALQKLIERHKTLRTSVKPAAGQLMLTLNDTPAIDDIPLVRNEGVWALSESDVSESVALLGKQSHHFNVRKGPLITAICSQLSTGEELLQLTAHHIAADDNSMGRLAVDFMVIYDALLKKKVVNQTVPDLKPVTIEYDEFLSDQHRKIESGAYDEKARAIGQRLEILLEQKNNKSLITIDKDSQSSSLFHIASLKPEVSLSLGFTDVVAALSWAFKRQFEQPDFVFCAHVALRRDAVDEPRVGMFVNLLPVFTGVDSEHDAVRHAGRTKSDFEEAMSFSDVPYELVLKKTESLRRLGRYPFDGFVNELRFEDQYPEGYSDIVIQRAFATDGHEISMSLIRSSHGDQLKLESPAFINGQKILSHLSNEMVTYLEDLFKYRQV
ncbi:MAG: AMP-binding protein [Cellvibrionaceae bacterium]